jgi:outer membrane receptor protein involved in Fe transport
MKNKYLLSCATAAVLVAGAAHAESNASPGSSGTTAVEDIVVTAQRRDESVQKVPMTVQAFTGDTLTKLNVQTFDDLLKYTPNVMFGNNGPGQGEIYMRGLSSGFRGNQSSATVANFPNVAIYLDEQSMQFPARNADIYMVDMNRLEVLEGPQGALFGGGAEAGAIRYITNKPRLDGFEAKAEASYSFTSDGAPSNSESFVINVPIVNDKFAVRAVFYNERQGGYIDSVPSTFTRSNEDLGNYYWNITPVGGLCPNHLPAGAAGLCSPPNQGQINNLSTAAKDFNPVTWIGGRVSAEYKINDDWNILISESLQDMNAEGLSVQYPTGSDFQPLQQLQVTSFTPSFNKDKFDNTSWTINGKLGVLKAIYTGGYTNRHIHQQMDYANYSRTGGGMYYQCTGGGTGWGGKAFCYSPLGYWDDDVDSTHFSNEFRLSTPDNWRIRAIAGVYWERFRIYDNMNFKYKTIRSCTAANLADALGGGEPCVANVRTAPGSTANQPGVRDDSTGFGEDTQRGYDQLAFFGSVDFDLIPDVLTISGGTRYYRYNEFEVGSQYATGTGCLNVPNGQCTGGMTNIDAANDHVVYTGFKSRASVTWHVNPDTNAYFLFSQGFRPGGFNRSTKDVIPGPGGLPQFRKNLAYGPDSLNNYEVGLKTALFDHRFVLNISAYYMQWTNVQFLLFNPPLGINTTFALNGPSYDVKGVEVQFVARLTEGLTLQGSGSYNRDRQSNSPCLVDNISGTPAFGNCITQAILKGSPNVQPFANPFGVSGSVAAFAPEFQGNLRFRYDWKVGDLNAFAMVGGSYVSSSWNQPATYPSGDGVLIPSTTYLRYKQPAYGQVDMSVGVTQDRWNAELFVNNLNNSHASTFTSSAQFIKSEVPLRPRVFGVRVGANF